MIVFRFFSLLLFVAPVAEAAAEEDDEAATLLAPPAREIACDEASSVGVVGAVLDGCS